MDVFIIGDIIGEKRGRTEYYSIVKFLRYLFDLHFNREDEERIAKRILEEYHKKYERYKILVSDRDKLIDKMNLDETYRISSMEQLDHADLHNLFGKIVHSIFHQIVELKKLIFQLNFAKRRIRSKGQVRLKPLQKNIYETRIIKFKNSIRTSGKILDQKNYVRKAIVLVGV